MKLDKIAGLEYEWQPDGSLTVITEPIPAVRMIEQQHNHAVYQWTFHNSVIAAFLGWQDSRNDRMNAVCFGNNEAMDSHILDDIAKFMDENKVSYRWKKGDVFALNNRLVMHSRNAFTGARRVFAAMFGDTVPSGEEKTDGIGQIVKDFSALNVSDVSYELCRLSFRWVCDICILKCLSFCKPTTFGMWRLTDPEETVYNAIRAGYRRFDSACDYGNEEATGRGIRRAITEGIVTRDDLYVTTKLWNTYHNPKIVPLALERCLKDLGLDYVDEFLIHFPISMEYVPFEDKCECPMTSIAIIIY